MPAGPDWVQSETVKAPCVRCGRQTDVVHMPTKFRAWYCEACCPACRQKAGLGI
jgi:hypothetical protein